MPGLLSRAGRLLTRGGRVAPESCRPQCCDECAELWRATPCLPTGTATCPVDAADVFVCTDHPIWSVPPPPGPDAALRIGPLCYRPDTSVRYAAPTLPCGGAGEPLCLPPGAVVVPLGASIEWAVCTDPGCRPERLFIEASACDPPAPRVFVCAAVVQSCITFREQGRCYAVDPADPTIDESAIPPGSIIVDAPPVAPDVFDDCCRCVAGWQPGSPIPPQSGPCFVGITPRFGLGCQDPAAQNTPVECCCSVEDTLVLQEWSARVDSFDEPHPILGPQSWTQTLIQPLPVSRLLGGGQSVHPWEVVRTDQGGGGTDPGSEVWSPECAWHPDTFVGTRLPVPGDFFAVGTKPNECVATHSGPAPTPLEPFIVTRRLFSSGCTVYVYRQSFRKVIFIGTGQRFYSLQYHLDLRILRVRSLAAGCGDLCSEFSPGKPLIPFLPPIAGGL